MSQQKFAPVTSSLLARKGAAAPSVIHAHPLSQRPEPHARETVKPAEPKTVEAQQVDPLLLRHAMALHHPHDPHHDDPEKPKKLFVAMSYGEFERLAIASLKIGLSKHEIVRDALDYYFDQIARDLGTPCACIGGHDRCAGKCS